MKNTALPRALFVAVICASAALGCNPFKWPPKLISERTWHLGIHQPVPPSTASEKAVPAKPVPTKPVPPTDSPPNPTPQNLTPLNPPSEIPPGR
jgi:hypothetical protein